MLVSRVASLDRKPHKQKQTHIPSQAMLVSIVASLDRKPHKYKQTQIPYCLKSQAKVCVNLK